MNPLDAFVTPTDSTKGLKLRKKDCYVYTVPGGSDTVPKATNIWLHPKDDARTFFNDAISEGQVSWYKRIMKAGSIALIQGLDIHNELQTYICRIHLISFTSRLLLVQTLYENPESVKDQFLDQQTVDLSYNHDPNAKLFASADFFFTPFRSYLRPADESLQYLVRHHCCTQFFATRAFDDLQITMAESNEGVESPPHSPPRKRRRQPSATTRRKKQKKRPSFVSKSSKTKSTVVELSEPLTHSSDLDKFAEPPSSNRVSGPQSLDCDDDDQPVASCQFPVELSELPHGKDCEDDSRVAAQVELSEQLPPEPNRDEGCEVEDFEHLETANHAERDSSLSSVESSGLKGPSTSMEPSVPIQPLTPTASWGSMDCPAPAERSRYLQLPTPTELPKDIDQADHLNHSEDCLEAPRRCSTDFYKLNEENTGLKQVNNSLREDLTTRNNAIDQLRECEVSLQEEKGRLQEDLEALKFEIEIEKTAHVDSKQSLEEANELARERGEKLKQASLEADKSHAKVTAFEKSSEKFSLVLRYLADCRDECIKESERLEAENSKLKREVDRIGELEDEKELLRSELQQTKQNDPSTETLRKESRMLKQRFTKVDKELEKTKARCEKFASDNQILKSENKQLSSTNESLHEENLGLQAERVTLTRQQSSVGMDLSEALEDRDNLRQQLQSREVEMERLQRFSHDLENQLMSQTATLEDAKQGAEKLRQQLKRREHEFKQASQDVKSLQDQLHDRDATMSQAEQRHQQDLQGRDTRSIQENQRIYWLDQQAQTLSSSLRQANEEIDRLEHIMRTQEVTIDEKENQGRSYTQRIDRLMASNESITEELNARDRWRRNLVQNMKWQGWSEAQIDRWGAGSNI